MPMLPNVQSQIAARTGRTNNATIDAYATPDAFGAQVGRAMVGVGQQLGNVGDAFYAREQRKRNEDVANRVAQSDFTRRELEVRNEVGPDGAGLQSKTLEAFDAFVEENANAIDDPIARTRYRNEMTRQRNNVSARSVTQEFTLDAAYSKAQADASIMALQNKIMADPAGYDDYIAQGNAVIDTRTDMPANMRENMKMVWRQNSADARFTGMLEAAGSVDDLDKIAAELVPPAGTGKQKDDFAGRDWTKELSPTAYEQLVNKIGTARKAIVTKADADARAALDTLDERAKDVNALIPNDELTAVAKVVKQSQNPVTIARFARINRDQDIIAEARRLTPSEQRAQINAVKGSPDTAHPGVPARVSDAINTAASKFGVSAGYLATTAQREYGQYFKRTPRQTNAKFAPVAVHSGVDMRNVRPDVVEAATVAGELFGAPLQATSAYRSQSRQDAIRAKGDPNRASVAKRSAHTSARALDISTAGMSSEDRARLAGALVDAGFTGIGEYDTHIHADFRAAVPNSFGDREGKTWGGWTYLSPEVAAALKERGFGAGKTAAELKRAAPVSYADNIDYGRGTSMTNEDGKPTSGVIGVMQFASGTFLDVMKDPNNAARIGVDTSKMTDAQILELRKDPEISVLAGAALAASNSRVMQRTLGRSVTDAELYMAHFLGGGGAVTLLKARELQPAQSAAKLMPQAAKANRPIFYDKDGKERTVEQVHNELAKSFVAAPSKVSYDDVQTRERVLQNTEKRLKDDPMTFVKETGSHDVPEFGIDTMSQYGAAVRSVAEYYNIPISDMKVLGADDLNAFKKGLDEGSADETLALMTSLQQMGSDVARAALKQLDQKDSAFAYAAELNLATNGTPVAGDIIRGQKRLNDNPSVKEEIGLTQAEQVQAFRLATGNALNEASPKVRQSIQDAALAHYVETVLSRGNAGVFDQDKYEDSVRAVIGGAPGSSALGEVNGEITTLPPGVTADQMEAALQSMTVVDWAEQSPDGVPPRYIDGTLIAAEDLADEAKLRAIGGGQYKVQLDDGTFAVTGTRGPNGRMDAYIFAPDPEAVVKLASRSEPGDVGEMQDAIRENLGPQDTGQGIRSFFTDGAQ